MVKKFTIDDFDLGDDPIIGTVWHLENDVIPQLNEYRDLYYRDKDDNWVSEIKRILPISYKWRDIFGED